MDELTRVLNRLRWEVGDDYKYLVGVMGLSEKMGNECRLVFWFDN
jgi:hypothetical protein